MKKIIAIVAVALVAIIVGVVIYIGSNLDSIVRAGVEKYAPRVTGTEVRLAGVSSSLTEGRVTLEGFFLGNPEGFKSNHAFTVDRLRVEVDPASLASDVIHIKEIAIDRPDIIYELGSGGRSNLQAIQANINKAVGAPQPAEEGAPAKKVIIDHVYVRDAQAALSASMLGGRTVALPMPDLHLTDIGKKSEGATMAEAGKQIMDAITKAATDAASKVDLEGIAGQAGEAVDDMKKKLENLLGR